MRRSEPRVRDSKLGELAAASIGQGLDTGGLTALGRYGDVVHVAPGTVAQHQGAWETWTYCILQGAMLLRTDDRIVGVASEGSWLFGAQPQRTHAPSPISAVAIIATELLAFRARDLVRAIADVPALVPATVAAHLVDRSVDAALPSRW